MKREDDYRVYLAVAGKRIRNPADAQPLPSEGEGVRVKGSVYWDRREIDGDVIRIDTKPASKRERAPKEG